MRCLPRANRRWLMVCSLVLFAPASAHATPSPPDPGFRVEQANIRLHQGVYLLDASIRFDFSPESIEAMDNGVSLTILVDVEVLRKYWLWGHKIIEQQARFVVGIHALSKRYLVKNLSSGESHTFRTIEEMASALGTVGDLPLAERGELDPAATYTGRVRARLDIEALPSPLRPLAYISPSWRLAGDWYEWALKL